MVYFFSATVQKFLVFFLVTILLVYGYSKASFSQSSPPNSEIRGVWLTNVDSDVLFFPENTRSAIAQLANLNFNRLYPTVWNWGYTLYPSEVMEKLTGGKIDPHEGLRNRDILQEIITEGHKRNMKVIPWFEFGFMAPTDSSLANLNPQWLTKKQNGETIWLEGNVHQRVWLNPLHPEVQNLISNLMVEIVKKYDIDGIQVDDHFGYPSEFGYDNYTVNLYRQEHNGNLPPLDSSNPDWIQWRADKITQYMEKLFHQIKAVKQNVIISVSPNPQEFSKDKFLLDWAKWERKGLIEELIVQVYRDNMDSFNRELAQSDLQLAKTHIPSAIGILSGLKGKPMKISLIEQQINSARKENFAGVSFFFYETLWNIAPETSKERQEFWQAILL